MKMTLEQIAQHKAAIIDEYGQGPAYLIRNKVDGVQETNIAGVPWFFQTSKEYKGLKRQIAKNRQSRRAY